jgi:hypothetical protein
MTFSPDEDGLEECEFEPEAFLIPPMEGILRRLFGAKWGIILVSAPEDVNLTPILDFLADFSLQLAYYSQFSAEGEDFENLDRDRGRLKTIEEILEEAGDSLPPMEPGEAAELDQPASRPNRNPEFVFLSELNSEVVAKTVAVALSGRLVVAGIRAESSFRALNLFRELLASDHLAAACLMGIIALNTVAQVCRECSVEVEYDVPDQDAFLLGCSQSHLHGFKGVGCSECDQTGFAGRILIHEGLEMSPKLRQGLVQHMSPRQLRLTAKNEGMTTLLDAVWALQNSGQTVLEEVIRIAEITDPGLEGDIGEPIAEG